MLGESLAKYRHVIYFLYLLFQVCSLFPPKPSVIPIKVVFQFCLLYRQGLSSYKVINSLTFTFVLSKVAILRAAV